MKTIIWCLLLFVSISSSQYSLKIENSGGAKHAGEFNTFRATVMNSGRSIHTFERTLPYDVPFPSSMIHETSGTVVLSFIFDGFVEVYNATGTKLWQQNFFKEMSPNYERTITVALGNTSIAFLTSDVRMPNAIVHKFRTDGVKEWETSLPHSMGYEIVMSPDERTIVAGSYFVLEDEVRQAASIIDTKGTVEANIPVLFRKGAFNTQMTLIALASEREIVLVSNSSKKEIGRIGRQTSGIITDIIWYKDELIVQENDVATFDERRFLYADPTIISYSEDLKELSRTTFKQTTFSSSKLQPGKNGIELILGDKILPIRKAQK